ncbi:hypothetical protein ACOME3_008333 [Neoechinorhynchus agilis]
MHRLYNLHTSENNILLIWTGYRRTLDQSNQFLIFDHRARQLINWIESTEYSLNESRLLQNKCAEHETEHSLLLKQHEDFGRLVRTLREKKRTIQDLINIADNLADVEHRYAGDVKCLCSQVEFRFAQFILDVEKEKQRIEESIGFVQHEPIDISSQQCQTGNDQNWPPFNKRDGHGRKRRHDFIVAELLQTERAYVNDLQCCINVYLKASRSEDAPDSVKNRETSIFGNIEDIFAFHNNVFLKELVRYESMSEDIGHCFVTTWVERIPIYVSYCMNKDMNNSVLDDRSLMQFFDSVHACHQNPPIEPIGSFLIKPVQRITKYQLLLKDLISSSLGQIEELQEALDLMLQIPRKANDAIHFNYLDGLIEDGFKKEQLGDVIKQESFLVCDNKQMFKKLKERRLFLFEVALIFAKEVKSSNGGTRYTYKTKLLTAELGLSEHIENDNLKFSLWTKNGPLNDHKLVLKAPNLHVKNEWIKAIRDIAQNRFLYGQSRLSRGNGMFLLTSGSSSSASSSLSVAVPIAPIVRRRRQERPATTSICSWASTDSNPILQSKNAQSVSHGLNMAPADKTFERINNVRRRKRRKRAIVASGPFVSAVTTKRRVKRWAANGNCAFKSLKTSQKKQDDEDHKQLSKEAGTVISSKNRYLSLKEKLMPLDTGKNAPVLEDRDPDSLASYRQAISNIICELKETEREYVRQLAALVNTYIHPKDIHVRKPVQLQSREKHAYGNIEQIYELHRDKIQTELNNCGENMENICSIFRPKRFSPYIKYYENQPRANLVYLEFKEYFEQIRMTSYSSSNSSDQLKSAKRTSTSDPILRLDLADLLILPTQRLPRYRLLLQTIDKYERRIQLCLPNDEPSRKALEAISIALKVLDEVIREAQMFLHLSHLEGFPTNQSLLTLGSLLKHGQLTVKQLPIHHVKSLAATVSGTPQAVSAFLFTQAILFSEEHPSESRFATPKFKYMFHVRMNQISFEKFVDFPKDVDSKLGFYLETVRTPDTSQQQTQIALNCTCSSAEERDSWYSVIYDQLKNQNDFISALTHPNTKPRTSQEQQNSGSLLSSLTGSVPDRANVIADYVAVKEDEISVHVGEDVQILAANQECRFFVHRPANAHGPAAEGWVPGDILWTDGPV